MGYRLKSLTSCKWSIDLLKGGQNGSRCKRLYLWTFTFPEVKNIGDATSCWSKLQRALHRNFGFSGVRVYELHRTHGLHIHVVTNKRLDVRAVRLISQSYGFGRINVIHLKGNPHYITKYLGKQLRETCLKGKRLWACIGGFAGAKVKDCVSVNPIKQIYDNLNFNDDVSTHGEHTSADKSLRRWCRWKKAEHLYFVKPFLNPAVVQFMPCYRVNA